MKRREESKIGQGRKLGKGLVSAGDQLHLGLSMVLLSWSHLKQGSQPFVPSISQSVNSDGPRSWQS